MAKRPVCFSCPKCGSDSFRVIKPNGLTISKDRQCKECSKCYSPPANKTAAICITIAGCFFVIPLLALIIYFSLRDSGYPGAVGWMLPTGLAVAGIYLILGGLKAFTQKPLPVPSQGFEKSQ